MPKLLHDIKFNLATSCMELAFLNEFIDMDKYSVWFCDLTDVLKRKICEAVNERVSPGTSGQGMYFEHDTSGNVRYFLLDEKNIDLFVKETKHMRLHRTLGKETITDIYVHDNYVNIDLPYKFTFSLEKQVFIEFMQDLCIIKNILIREYAIIDVKNNCIRNDTDNIGDERTVICLIKRTNDIDELIKLDEWEQKEIIDRILSKTKHVFFEPK